MPDALTAVDFWLDPQCPWAWITSRWLLEVEKVRPITPRWHIMSLSLLNKDRELSEDYRKSMDRAWGPVRVCMAAMKEKGDEILLPLYTAIGTLVHSEGRREPEVLGEALEAVGLPAGLLEAAQSTEYDEAIAKSHEEGIGLVGEDVGTPIISVGGASIFGPVVTPIPRGEAAGLLWDGVLLVINTDGFFELKKSRDRRPAFD
jgi:hypothetical protein